MDSEANQDAFVDPNFKPYCLKWIVSDVKYFANVDFDQPGQSPSLSSLPELFHNKDDQW
jgi:hypothetical protein